MNGRELKTDKLEEIMDTRPEDGHQKEPVPVYLARDNRYQAIDTVTDVTLGLFNGGLIAIACLPLLIALMFLAVFLQENVGIPTDFTLLAALVATVTWRCSRKKSRR